jgi:hypothetical protein
MKKLIKTLTILLVTIFFSNQSHATTYTMTNGTWSPTLNQANLTVADSLILNGGTFTLTDNRTVLGINFISGTIHLKDKNLTARITMEGNGSRTITADNGNADRITGAVTLAGGTLTMATATQFTVMYLRGGTLNLGTFALASNVNVLSNTSTISAASTGASILALRLVGGTLRMSGSTFGISSLNFAGGNLYLGSATRNYTVAVTISGSGKLSGTGILYTSNTVTVNGGTLTIDTAEFIAHNLTFVSANDINTINNGLLAFDNTANTITGAADDRNVNGTIRIYVRNGSKSAAIYPIGNGTEYAPIELSTNGASASGVLSNVNPASYGTHYIDIKYIGTANPYAAIDNTLNSASGLEYWTISTSSTNPAATFKFFVNSTGSTFGQTVVQGTTTDAISYLELAQFNTGTNKWTKLDATVASITGGYSVTASSAISPNTSFVFGSTNPNTSFLSPLPVSIIDFSAKVNSNNIDIKWSTASEKDNMAFVVEKSIDGQTWSAIGTVKGAKTSNVVNNYGLVDYKAVAGFQYYRLKQIDLDGTVNYSKAIAVNFSKASTLNVNLFPNPAKDALNITTENNATGEVHIQILNSMGETVYNKVVDAGLVQSIDIASFIPGVYYVSVIAEGESKIIRLLKN